MLIGSDSATEGALIDELIQVRDAGLPKLRDINVPALARVSRVISQDDASPDHVVVEALLRRAVARLGGGRLGDAAAILFGLDADTRTESSRVRREMAATALGRRYETFRKNYERPLIGDVATQILVLSSEQHTRDARRSLERAESPEASAMPQVWLERFAAYYRIWTPVNGLGNDLTAYRSTLLEHDRPWDRRFGDQGPDDHGYLQEEQAQGYASFALYHYAHFEWQLRQFSTLYGGQWLLSDADAEQAVADAVYRIFWHTPWNERDQSFLRGLVAETPGQELHGFLDRLRSTELGRETEREWFDWADACECDWEAETSSHDEYFPTARRHKGISDACPLHQVVAACGDYLDLVDQDWKRLADWYHLNGGARRGVAAPVLYHEARRARQAPLTQSRATRRPGRNTTDNA